MTLTLDEKQLKVLEIILANNLEQCQEQLEIYKYLALCEKRFTKTGRRSEISKLYPYYGNNNDALNFYYKSRMPGLEMDSFDLIYRFLLRAMLIGITRRTFNKAELMFNANESDQTKGKARKVRREKSREPKNNCKEIMIYKKKSYLPDSFFDGLIYSNGLYIFGQHICNEWLTALYFKSNPVEVNKSYHSDAIRVPLSKPNFELACNFSGTVVETSHKFMPDFKPYIYRGPLTFRHSHIKALRKEKDPKKPFEFILKGWDIE